MSNSANASNVADGQESLAGGGEMGALMRSIDWSKTVVGPVGQWPQSLRTAVSICLGSRHPIVIWWGREHTMFYNDAYRPILGATKHPQFLGGSGKECWAEIWHILGPMMNHVLDSGEATWSEDLLLPMTRNGYLEETYFTFSYSPIRDESAGVGGVFCACTENTSRVLSERRLRTLREFAFEAKTQEHAAELAAAVLAHNPQDIPFALIYLLDQREERARLVASAGLEAGRATSPREVDLSHCGDSVWPLARVAASGEAEEVSGLRRVLGDLPAGDWPEAPDSALVAPIPSPGQDRIAGVLVLGISPRRAFDDDYRGFFDLVLGHISTSMANARAYEEERRRAEALAEIDRAKTLFFSNVSHEFRTPLTLMLGPVEDLLSRSHTDLSPAAKGQLEVAHRNSLRLLRLVNTLLDFSRIEAGRVQSVFEPTDLAAFTAELASVFGAATERAGLRLTVDCPTLSEPVYVDRDMWEKIVLNLVSNAFKFTFEGEIAVTLRAVGHVAELRVRDTGVGVPAEEMPRLFERFHRVPNMRSRTHEGSGIGLALVQELVKLHGGSVYAESRLDEGTTFIVNVPLGKDHLPAERIGGSRTLTSTSVGAAPYVEEALRWLPEDALAEEIEPLPKEDLLPVPCPAGEMDESRPRLLVADDNADMRQYLARLLAERYNVETVPDGQAALTAARDRRPDLVLSDVMMPHLDGLGLVRELRADPVLKTVPVILLSARAGEESRIEGLQQGADDYLIKPFSARELMARVSAHLDIAQLRKQSEEALRESEARFRGYFEMGLIGMAITSPAKGIMQVNDRLCDMWGYSREELLRLTWAEITHADDLAADVAQFNRLLAGEIEGYAIEKRFTRKDGSTVCSHMSVRGIRDASGALDHVVACAVDITARKQAEEAAAAAHRQVQSLINNTPAIVYAFDLEGRFLLANTAVAELFRTTPEQMIGKRRHEFMPKVDADWHEENDRKAIDAGRALEFEEYSQLPGRTITWLTTKFPLRDAHGSIYAVAGISADVSDRKKAEEALRELELEERIILDNANEIIAYHDTGNNLIWANRAYLNATGLPLSVLKGRKCYCCWGLDRLCEHCPVITAIQTGEPQEGELTPENQAHWPGHQGSWLVRAAPVKDSAGNIVGAIEVAHDITARKQAETELLESRARLAWVLEKTGVGTWFNTLPLGQLNWDEQTRRLFFVPPGAEPTIELFWSRVHTDDREPTRLAVEKAVRERTLYEIDHRVVNPDTGEVRWLRSVGQATYAADGTPTRFDGINHDITDRKQAEEALRESEARFRLALDHSPVLVAMQDSNLVYRWAYNTRTRRPEDVVGKTDADLFAAEDMPSILEAKRKVLHNGEVVRHEHWLTSNGQRVFLDCYYEPVRDSAGNIIGVGIAAVNLTEQKRAEEALRETRDYLEKLFGYANAPIICWDPRRAITRFNPAFEHLTGYAADEVIGRDLSMLFPDETRDDSLAKIERALTERWDVVEIPIQRKDGETRVALWNSANVYAEDGTTILATIAQGQDITERKRTEEVLGEHRELLEAVINSLPMQINLIRGSDLRLQFVNPAYQALAPGKEMVGRTLGEVWPETGQDFAALCRRVLETGETYHVENQLNRIRRQPDGPLEERYFSWSLLRVRLPGEKGWGILNPAWDTTARHQAEAAMRKSEEHFRRVFSNNMVPMALWTKDGGIVDANDGLLGMLGYARAELGAGDFRWDAITPADYRQRDLEAIGEVDAKGFCTPYEKCWRHKDGRLVPIVIGAGKFDDHAGTGVLFAVDITERKQAEEALKASLAEKEVLLKEIHHRVKNNMQVISSLVDLQADRTQDQSVRAVLQDVMHRVRAMALVHENLYRSADMARVEFAEYAQSLLGYLWRAHDTTASGIRLTLDLEPVPLSVNVAVPCGLILNELATNALKHAFRGRAPSGCDGEVAVSLRNDGEGRVCLRVRDNGVGLPSGLDWRQANSLGLRVVQLLAKQLDAALEVCSGEGTEFTITFGERKTLEHRQP